MFINVFIGNHIFRYLNKVLKYFIVNLNTLNSANKMLLQRGLHFDSYTYVSRWMFCTHAVTSTEPERTYIIGNCITPLFSPLSAILNYHCQLLPLYIHIVFIFHRIYAAFMYMDSITIHVFIISV